jgi:uncharacterized protein DUF3570
VKARWAGLACKVADVGANRKRTILAVAIAVVTLTTAGRVPAQSGFDISFHTFQDSRGVTVLSPDVLMNKDFTDRTALRIKFGVDAITAASDSCARCHPQGANNGRVVGGLSMVRKYGDTKWTLGGEVSKELFYTASTFLTSATRDLNKGNTTVAGGFSYSLNRPQLHPSLTSETQHSVDMSGSVSQSWSKTTITQVGYELNQINGYQSNPFLRTSVNGVMTVGEAPDARTRQAFTARVRQALPGQTFLEADYRHYIDSWSVNSNALAVGLSHHFGNRVIGGGSYRWYDQTGAFFYAPSYSGSPQYFTGDFRLFPFDSDQYMGHLDIMPKGGIFMMPPGTVLKLQYERYLATTGFQAGVFTAGFQIPLK